VQEYDPFAGAEQCGVVIAPGFACKPLMLAFRPPPRFAPARHFVDSQ
jgi:hypothetical protein